MAARTVRVAVAQSGDIERLIPLWVASRSENGQTRAWAERAARDGRMQTALDRPGVTIFLATVGQSGEGGAAVDAGYAVLTDSPLSGLGEERGVWIDQLFVTAQHRGDGVAKALLTRVTAYAEELGSTQLICCVPVQARAANRYFARLGFSAVVTARATSTASLRRRLTGDESSAAATLRRRRSLRARTPRLSADS